MVNETFKFLVLLKIYYNFKTVNIFFHKFYHIFKKKIIRVLRLCVVIDCLIFATKDICEEK